MPSTVDPPLAPGMVVIVVGLRASPHLNGLLGTVVNLNSDSGRWLVELTGDHGVKALKPENLQAPSPVPHSADFHQQPQRPPEQPQRQLPSWVEERDAAVEKALAPSEDDSRNAERCVNLVNKIARRLGADCVLVGSWAQETSLHRSDMDLALVFNGQFEDDGDKTEKVQVLQSFVARARGTGLRLVEEVFQAKVPIVRLEFGEAPDQLVEVDISIGNSRSGMLDDYIREDLRKTPHCRRLLLLVKHWARCRNINKALFGFPNSLSWSLLVVFFFRSVSTGSLAGPVRNVFCDFLEWVRSLGFRPNNRVKLSTREGRWLPLSAFDKEAVLWIEDPTNSRNNVCRSLRLTSWHAVIEEVDRALECLRNMEALSTICSQDAPSRLSHAPPGLRGALAKREGTGFSDSPSAKTRRLA
eukprot:TRINITY_DN68996_c0_g1_i1.p1 TRINITY_DN68996_c0_g1~~TRINITY_DN68996_c0_g1_i1.p1  ORF type:complete len:414 (+),score=62.98 TRINITY_DN68996_c0_g1_i1:133-1374(+)